MDALCSELMRNYDIKIINAKKYKGFYIITSDKGKYSLKKTDNDEFQLGFQLGLQKKLEEAGFFNFAKIYETKEKRACVCSGGANYILTDYIEGGEVDFDKEAHIDGIINTLADFHKYSDADSYGLGPKAEDMRKIARKYYIKLSAIKRKIDISKGLSEFDMLFLKNCDYYMNNAIICEAILNSGKYGERYEKAISYGSVCHNLLKRENLIVKNGEVWLASLSGCRLDYYTADIAMLIERYMKYSKVREISLMDMVNKYSNYRLVDNDDYAIILAGLLLPESFVKISELYYSKKRSWAPTSVMDKMKLIISTKATNAEYLRPLLEIVK